MRPGFLILRTSSQMGLPAAITFVCPFILYSYFRVRIGDGDLIGEMQTG